MALLRPEKHSRNLHVVRAHGEHCTIRTENGSRDTNTAKTTLRNKPVKIRNRHRKSGASQELQQTSGENSQLTEKKRGASIHGASSVARGIFSPAASASWSRRGTERSVTHRLLGRSSEWEDRGSARLALPGDDRSVCFRFFGGGGGTQGPDKFVLNPRVTG